MSCVKDVVPSATHALGEFRARRFVPRSRRCVLRYSRAARDRLRAHPFEPIGPVGAITAEDIVGLVLAVVVLAYLVYALIAPEKLG
jgi:K+-transporting ATPase KdpF subunit